MAVTAEFSGKTALVTGAAGFIGSALARRLRASGAAVHGVSRTERAGNPDCDRWWQSDLGDLGEARRLLDAVRPDLVFHLGALVDGARNIELVLPALGANLLSTVNLMVALADLGRARLLLAGSLEDAGLDAEPVPASPYAASKIAAGAYARMFRALYGTELVWVRLFMVYGPAQRDARKVIPYVITSLLRGEGPALSSARRLVDWVYVDDVVDAFLAAAVAQGVEGKTFDVGSGELVSVRSVVERLVEIIDPGIAPRFGAMPDRPLERERVADLTASSAWLGWKPRTSLDEGLRKTVEWYRGRVAVAPGR